MNEDEELQKILEKKRAEERIKAALRLALTAEAYERMMNVKMANPELFSLASQQVLALYQRTGKKLSDEELKRVLMLFKAQTSHEPKIQIKRK